MTRPSDRLPNPELILRGVDALRWRMRLLLGSTWEAFRLELDRLVHEVASATTSASRQRAVEELLRLGQRLPVAPLFDAIVAHATSSEAMEGLVQFQREQERREDHQRPKEKAEHVASTAPMPREDELSIDEPKPEPRYVNVNFVDGAGRDVSGQKPLVADRKYRLRVGIGQHSERSIVKTPEIVRADLLRPTTSGHWLKVVATSADLSVSPIVQWLFLPTTGAAWSCDCDRDNAHTCSSSRRRQHLSFHVSVPRDTKHAELRLTISHACNVIQSLLVTATIARSAAAAGSNEAVVDYNLSDRLTDLRQVEPRALSVMMNDSGDGSHLLVFNGAGDDVVALRLSEGQMRDATTMMRDVMRRIHVDDRGPQPQNMINRYDANNAKPFEQFTADLRDLAARGWLLWSTLWTDQIRFWKEHRDEFVSKSDVVQVARKERSTSVFPWALVYSIPLESTETTLCRLLGEKEWRAFKDGAEEVPARCPFESRHADNMICPYGFWGFRYEIEQPPSLQHGQKRAPSIPVDPLPLDVIVALSDELDSSLLNKHLATLEAQHPSFNFQWCRTRDAIRLGLGKPGVEVVYFYCHGRRTPLPGSTASVPSLGVGSNELIHPQDLVAWVLNWPDDHWQTTRPLVFINGCHTADTVPQTLVNFVDTFSASLDAGGVIGTEITLHQRVANEVGETFLAAFQRGLTVGQSLRQARGSLLKKGNLLGLVYTAYCRADYGLTREIK